MAASTPALGAKTCEPGSPNAFACWSLRGADLKWNETQIKVSEILALTDEKPLFGHPSGKRAATHWICFMKGQR